MRGVAPGTHDEITPYRRRYTGITVLYAENFVVCDRCFSPVPLLTNADPGEVCIQSYVASIQDTGLFIS